MVEEIIYTSAEKGLKQGSRGFCTVVSTTGMSVTLAERLESMSGYRHAFPLHDPKASLNPVCYSHMTTRLAGKSLHVVSRVADAGQDYTGRSNKLAHHLVIDNVASLTAGPARLLVEPGVVVSRWDGTVRHIPPRELRCSPLPASVPLTAWQSLTGDEGWAGAVAEKLLQSSAPLSIIFNPGTDTLTLVREVLDLIPAPQRWNVTFSTYFTRLLAGAECQLRFVLNDTPEATSLRNDARARVIDLTSSLPAATGGTLVTMARQGQLTHHEPAPPQAPTATRARASVETSGKDTPKDTASEIAIPKLKPDLSPPSASSKPQPPPEFPSARRSKKPLIVGISIAVVLCIVAAGAVFTLTTNGDNDPFSDLVSKTVPQDQPPTDAENEATRAREQAEKKSRDQQERERLEQLAAKEAAKKKANEEKRAAEKMAADQEAERVRQEAMEAQAKAAREAALQEEGPFPFIKRNPNFRDNKQQLLFNLPKPGEVYSVGNGRTWPQLRVDGKEIQLSLCEEAAPLFAGAAYKLRLRQDSIQLNEWIVEAISSNTVIPIAKYILTELPRDPANTTDPDTELQFEWLRDAVRETKASELLRWWPLKIQIGTRKIALLQRVAEIPETEVGRPTWAGLLDSKPISVISTNAITAVGFDKATNAKFTIEIQQADFPIQTIGLPISPEPPDGETKTADPPQQEDATVKYFNLMPPLDVRDDLPEITDALLGFGQIQLTVSQSEKIGLTLHPRISVTLRLLRKEILDNLPELSMNSDLKTLIKTPTELRSWNASRAEKCITNLPTVSDSLLNDVANWHTQPMKAMPRRNVFEAHAFLRLAKSAVERVHTVVPQYKQDVQAISFEINQLLKDPATQAQVGKMEQLRAAQVKLAQATESLRRASLEYQPIVTSFAAAMTQLSQAMTNANTKFLSHYDAISERLNSCLAVEEQIHVRCTLFADIDVVGADDSERVVIYFLETTSPNWPADSVASEE